ncbi:hypothetical protein [Lacinutrix algicola]|uniref:hypothetical protein n=1 Tax=Lacinutrix algicola TaxID=342954 RepID=UPI0006E34D82|nr:hypothetical protein [Lacinutrix algicola]
MNKIFTLILIFTFGLSYSQSKKEQSGIKNDSIFIGNCESGTKRAIKDAENKIYNSYSYGLKIKKEDDWKFDEFYEKYMESKYGILIIDGGCLITPDSKCYTDKMKEIITAEFGSDIFKKSREEAKTIYNKRE